MIDRTIYYPLYANRSTRSCARTNFSFSFIRIYSDRRCSIFIFFFFLKDTAPPEISPLSLPDALPIPLPGRVLPIGGLREKSLAAQRAGLKRVIFPRDNEPDLDALPPETRKAITFIPADTIEEVFEIGRAHV